MMRTRMLKPGFFDNEDLARCQPLARILFEGLWCLADREGRLEDRPKRIKVKVLPYDDCDVDEFLNELADAGFVIRYQVDRSCYIQIVNFLKHQKPHHKEFDSVISPPDDFPDSAEIARRAPEDVDPPELDGDEPAPVNDGSTMSHAQSKHVASMGQARVNVDSIRSPLAPLVASTEILELDTSNHPTGGGAGEGKPSLRVVKANKSAQLIMGLREHSIEPTLQPRDHASLKACPRPVTLIVEAYLAARAGLWPPGETFLRNNLSIHAVIDRLDGYETWVASGRSSTNATARSAPRRNDRYVGDLSVLDDPPEREHA